MESCSTRVTAFSIHLFAIPDDIDPATQSPYVPFSQAQAAVVQYRLWNKTNLAVYKDNLDALKKILGILSKRWMVAGMIWEFPRAFAGL